MKGHLVFLLLVPRLLAAQAPALLGGRVVDAASGLPVPQAEVRVAGQVAVSGPDGEFWLGSLPPGRAELRVRRIGYAPARRGVDLVPATTLMLELRLTARPVLLDEIAAELDGSGRSIDGTALARRGRELAQALDGWEGVTMRPAPDGARSPTVRGSAPDEVLVLVDGFPLNDPYTGRADLRRIPSASVSRVTLEAGAQGARYGGRAISGVLAIETRRTAPSEISSWLTSHGTLGARATVGAGNATLTVGRDALIDEYDYDVPVTRGGGVARRSNAGGAVWTLNGRWVGPADLTLRASTSERGLPGPVSSPTPTARGRDASVLLGGRSRGAYEAKASVELLATRFEDRTPAVGPAYDSRTEGVGLAAGVARTWFPRLAGHPASLTFGAEARHDRFAGNGDFPDAARQTRGSLRADARLALSGGLRVLPAVRLDWWTGRAAPVASGRVGAEVARGGTTVSLSLGSAVTPPVLADLFFREGNGVRVNPELRPERVRWEVEGGLRHEARAGRLPITGGVRGFAGRVDDMILWGQSPGFRFAWSPANFDVVRRGGEASLALGPVRGLTLGGGATLSLVTRDWSSGTQMLYRPRFTSQVSAGWAAGGWSADLRWHHVGRRYPNSAGTNPLDPIDLVSLGAEGALSGPLRLRADLTDLLDRRPAFIAGYPAPGRTASLTLTVELP